MTVADQKKYIAELTASLLILKSKRYWTFVERDYWKQVSPVYALSNALIMCGRHKNKEGRTVLAIACVAPNATAELTASSLRRKNAERVIWWKIVGLFNERSKSERESIIKRYHEVLRVMGPGAHVKPDLIKFSEKYEFIFSIPEYVKVDSKRNRLTYKM